MTKEELLSSEFLKQFKDSKDFGSHRTTSTKEELKTMLQGEMEAHLGHAKNQKKTVSDNSRNGYGKKKIKTQHCEFDISVPRDRTGVFEPQLVPKRSRLSEGIENLIISLYAKGMSNSDIEDQLNELYGFTVSTFTISVVTD